MDIFSDPPQQQSSAVEDRSYTPEERERRPITSIMRILRWNNQPHEACACVVADSPWPVKTEDWPGINKRTRSCKVDPFDRIPFTRILYLLVVCVISLCKSYRFRLAWRTCMSILLFLR
jgi:hypothetical protein